MPLITPEQLIIYLDLPDNTQPTDRAQLICTLVIDAVTQAAGATLTEPFAAGLQGVALPAAARLYHNPILADFESLGDSSTRYGVLSSILTPAEQAQVAAIVGSGGPKYSFPEWDWSWTSVTTSTLTD